MKTESRGPLIIAIALLLLPVLYVGSYFALVVPRGIWGEDFGRYGFRRTLEGHYRVRGADRCFYPLEQIDRKVRPRAWPIGGYHPDDIAP